MKTVTFWEYIVVVRLWHLQVAPACRCPLDRLAPPDSPKIKTEDTNIKEGQTRRSHVTVKDYKGSKGGLLMWYSHYVFN